MGPDEALTEAQRLIPLMTEAHHKKLIQSINALRQLSGKSSIQEAATVMKVVSNDWTLHAIADILVARGIEQTTAFMLQKRCGSISAYREKIAGVLKFFDPVSEVQQRAMFNLGVVLLCNNLAEMNVPVSGMGIMNHVHRIPSLINQAFPGYVRLGLLNMIIRNEKPTRAARVRKKENTNVR